MEEGQNPPPVQTPSETEVQPPTVMHWRFWHTLGVLGFIGVLVYLALRPPGWELRTFWAVGMAALLALTLVVGRGVTGVWKGAFVDERFKMSLARFQMLLWTILVLSAFGTMAIARARTDAIGAMDIAVPATIWALLGISTSSLIGSPLIKNAKKKETPQNPDQKVQVQGKSVTEVTWEGQVVKNRSIDEATFADMFRGDYVENFAVLDMAKIQMFFFTVILVLAYGFAIEETLRGSDLASLPDVGEGMLPLLGISHAGYLASKAISTTSSAPGVRRVEQADH